MPVFHTKFIEKSIVKSPVICYTTFGYLYDSLPEQSGSIIITSELCGEEYAVYRAMTDRANEADVHDTGDGRTGYSTGRTGYLRIACSKKDEK